MAFLRPIRHKLLQGATTLDEMKASEVHVNETPYLERYEIAKKLFDEDKTILYFYYFSDDAEQHNRFYTYPITRETVEYYMTKKYYEDIERNQ